MAEGNDIDLEAISMKNENVRKSELTREKQRLLWEANILIRIPGDEKEVKGSLRFNYMVPVPDECIEKLVIKDVEDEKYRLLLNKEYQFCMNNAERIQKKANKIYEMVTTNRKQILTDNSCAFHILEDGYREYIEKYLKSDSK